MTSEPLRVVVVGQTPPPFHGQGVMLERLVQSKMDAVSIYHVRMAFSQTMDQVGQFQFGKILHLFAVILRIFYARFAHRAEVLYYPPAGPNRIPVYRDIVILMSTRWLFRKTIFHFQAGGVSTLYPRLSPWMRWLFRRAYFGVDGSIRLSTLTPEDAVEMDAKREFIIPNCADDVRSQFCPADGIIESDNSAVSTLPSLRILYLGTVCRTKGILVLLEACVQLRERGIPFALEVVGSFQPAGFAEEVHSVLSEQGIADQVTIAGQLTGDAKFERFAAADVFCFPTFYECEAFPCVVVEAMCFGLPVVSTRWRGVPTIVDDGRTGLLADPQDSDAIAQCLVRLAQDDEFRSALGAAGRAKYVAEYTTERHIEEMESMFLNVARLDAAKRIIISGTSVDTIAESV